MRVTRQRAGTERRLVVSLARHERMKTASEILTKLKRSKYNHASGKESGALVRWEHKPGDFKFLYLLRPDQF